MRDCGTGTVSDVAACCITSGWPRGLNRAIVGAITRGTVVRGRGIKLRRFQDKTDGLLVRVVPQLKLKLCLKRRRSN